MGTCFVIQPFDKGPFDKRFDDVVAPAIKAAGLEPYRVDRDPAVIVPIEEIEKGIRGADVCLADITLDNPNVWFELGYSLAARKDHALICSTERKGPYPFDIHHRQVIQYSAESSRDFATLAEEITRRLAALLKKSQAMENVGASSPVAEVEGLSQIEIAGLVCIAQNLDEPEDSTSAYLMRRDMEKLGFTKIATTLAIAQLLKKGYAEHYRAPDEDGTSYTALILTPRGLNWITHHQDLFVLRSTPPEPPF